MCPFHRAIAAERIGKNVNARIGLPKRVYNSQHSALRAPQVANVLQSASCAQGFPEFPSVGALEAAPRGGTPSIAAPIEAGGFLRVAKRSGSVLAGAGHNKRLSRRTTSHPSKGLVNESLSGIIFGGPRLARDL